MRSPGAGVRATLGALSAAVVLVLAAVAPVLVDPAGATTHGPAPAYPACQKTATTQVAMDQCVGRGLTQARSLLASLLTREAKVYGSRVVHTAQVRWLMYEKAECTLEASTTKGGTAYGLDLTSCELSLTTTRAQQVFVLLEERAATSAARAAAAAQVPPRGPLGSLPMAQPTDTVDLPVVLCPTDDAIASSTSVPVAPTRRTTVPTSLARSLAVYSDARARMQLLAPKGWSCTATFGADGSGSVIVAPAAEHVTFSTLSSKDEAIVGGESSACAGCTLGQACPVFANAAAAYAAGGFTHCATKPSAESVVYLTPTLAAFVDPPGVKGDADPSGGPYAANAVMTYIPNTQNGSWEETCALPDSLATVCTTALTTFVSWYGKD